MPAPSKLSNDALMANALSVRRGEKRIADLPAAHQDDVRKFMRKTPESKLRAASLADIDERRTMRSAPQRRFARTRGF
jgi:hypothetical protein